MMRADRVDTPVRACANLIVMAMTTLLARGASAQLPLSPTSPKFQAVVRLAQDGYGDSARRVISRILAATPSTDPGFPEALYTAGAVANTGDDTQTWFKRVVVEYPSSPWADKAQLRLAELAYGNGNMDEVVSRVTRLFTDYPHSPVIATAALWGARAAFDRQKVQLACDWLTRGLGVAGDDIELRNQLQFARQGCNIGSDVQLAPVTPESLRASPPGGSSADTGSHPVPPSGTPRAGNAASPWRIQVAAISDKTVIRRLIQRIEAAGFKAYTVPGPRGLTKVQAGPFPSRGAAAAQLAKLRTATGGSAFVTPAP